MGIFGKKSKRDEAFKIQLEREALEKMNGNVADSDILPFEQDSISDNKKIKAPNVITAEELMGTPEVGGQKRNNALNANVETIKMQSETKQVNSAEFLYQKMTQSRKQHQDKILANDVSNVPEKAAPEVKEQVSSPTAKTVSPKAPITTEPKKYEPFDLDKAMLELRQNAGIKSPTAENIPFVSAEKPKTTTLETLKQDLDNGNKEETVVTGSFNTPPKTSAEERRTSLLARCNAYLEDEEFGTHKKEDPEKYKLESVESILQDFEARASQRIQKTFAQKSGNINSPTAPVKKEDNIDLTKTMVMPDITSTNNNQDIKSNSHLDEKTSNDAKEENPVKHYFVAPTPDTENKGDTQATIILDPKKIGLENTVKNPNATQVFSTITSHTEEKNLNTEENEQVFDTTKADEPVFEDYNNINDKKTIEESLASSKKRLTFRVTTTFILFIISLLMIFPLGASLKANGAVAFYGINLIVSLLAVVLNFNIVKSLPMFFKAEPDTDLPAGIAALSGVIHSAACLIVQGNSLILTPVILLSLLFFNLAKLGRFSLIAKNFGLISNSATKNAISIITNKAANKHIVGNSIEGSSLVCCGVKTTNVQNFLKYSFCGDPTAKRIQSITIIGAFLGLGLGLAAALLNSWNILLGVTVFTATTCIAASPATLYLSHLPFKATAGRLNLYGAMLTGYKAADEFDNCNALALDSKDLFPEGTIRLVDMKLLSLNPIDQSLLDAEALATAIGSPIAGIFKQVNNTVSTTKPKVDSFIYEDKMGISGWVNDRRVFIGNRILLEGHGFTNLPPIELDKKIMRKGYFPVYLVSDNVPCALFVVKYVPDEEIAYELRRLCNTGTTVLVHNCDPNISAGMLSDYFGLYEETISIMSKQGSEQYKIITEYKEGKSAGAAYTDSISGLIATLTASIKVKNSITAMSIIYVMLVILGITAVGVFTFTPLISSITAIPLLIFQLVSTLVIFLPPLLRRP